MSLKVKYYTWNANYISNYDGDSYWFTLDIGFRRTSVENFRLKEKVYRFSPPNDNVILAAKPTPMCDKDRK